MNPESSAEEASVMSRLLLLYGAYNLIHNAAFLFGYRMLPVGAMRGSYSAAIAGREPRQPGPGVSSEAPCW